MTASAALEPSRGGLVVRGITATYLTLLVALPLLALVVRGFEDGLGGVVDALASPVARHACWLSLWTAVVVGVLNGIAGTLLAWVLVRYPFPARGFVSSLVDLPLSIPTLVAGVMLALLYGPETWLGRAVDVLGVRVVYAPPSIVLALLFVTLPFVVRAVEPVLLELDPAEEEAAATLGASPWTTFRHVVFPAIAPAAVSGSIRAMARSLAEFGSIAVVAGNIPLSTLTAPVHIFGEIESGQTRAAAALSVVLLAVALVALGVARAIERRAEARRAR